MNKTLIKHGNSLALVIDKPILEMLQITADTPLELSTNGDAILTRNKNVGNATVHGRHNSTACSVRL